MLSDGPEAVRWSKQKLCALERGSDPRAELSDRASARWSGRCALPVELELRELCAVLERELHDEAGVANWSTRALFAHVLNGEERALAGARTEERGWGHATVGRLTRPDPGRPESKL